MFGVTKKAVGSLTPSYVGVGTFALSPTLPAGITTNDLLILVIASGAVATPAGWTRITGSGADYCGVFYARYGTSAPTGLAKEGAIYAFRGVLASGSPLEAIATIATGSGLDGWTSSSPAITTALANNLVILVGGLYEQDPYNTNNFGWVVNGGFGATPTKVTEFGVVYSATSEKIGVVLWYGIKATPGSTGAESVGLGTQIDNTYGTSAVLISFNHG